MFLESRGFEVATAGNPKEGLQKLVEERADAVVLDIMMPDGTEGFHWLWSLRRHPDAAVRDVPVVVVSSIHSATGMRFQEGESDETGSYLPAQAFLDKPADPDVLARKLESVLGIQ